jgi:hypothetical protein
MKSDVTPPPALPVHGRVQLLSKSLAWLAMVLTILVMLPLSPRMPYAGLDASWGYALNEAVAHHLVFGRDLIFTFGPFGAAYTGLYHPATDAIMLLGSAFIAIGLISGFALLTFKRRPLLFLALPAVVILVHSIDPVFMALPLFFLLAVFSITSSALPDARRIGLGEVVLMTLLVCAIGILPLVKGSFSGVAGLLGVLAIAMLILARHFLLALFLSAATIASGCFGWVWSGQPLAALPSFFLSQKPIISGYSEAMSYSGPFVSVVYAVVPAAICLAVFYWSCGRHRRIYGVVTTIGIAAYLFVTFKAGFVRQDTHPLTTVGALLFLALALASLLKPRTALLLALVSLVGWVMVERHSENLRLVNVTGYFHDAKQRTIDGIQLRRNADTLPKMFVQAEQSIREQFPLAPVRGSVDVYPTELAFVFAHHMDWAGRPIPQSYSAYTPELDRINAQHLLGSSAPQNVFFAVAPIDGRLASLEDASSWPILLTNYRVAGQDLGYLHLVRRQDAQKPDITKLGETEGFLNAPIDVPNASGPVLAAIDIQKTLLGKIVLAAYKLPQLSIEMTLGNGQMVQSRYIPEMGKTGFFVSPYIGSTGDFLLTASGSIESMRVRQIRIIAPKMPLWAKAIHVSFTTFAIPSQPKDVKLPVVEASAAPSQFSSLAANAAQCNLEFVNDLAIGQHAGDLTAARGVLSLIGWAAPSAEKGISPDAIWAVLTASDGSKQYFNLPVSSRADVRRAFPRLTSERVGFDGSIDASRLMGKQELAIYTVSEAAVQGCPNRSVIDFR